MIRVKTHLDKVEDGDLPGRQDPVVPGSIRIVDDQLNPEEVHRISPLLAGLESKNCYHSKGEIPTRSSYINLVLTTLKYFCINHGDQRAFYNLQRCIIFV